ncbi:lysylphosphatidylglycerol synthase transmembrane domain-containing protein [Thermotoga sp. KOL6]|uniref:lysylphosphatidylglycerol synthase transmembrane domain-containing protein n=1 Tax=Thermotoga sp. KOL6 TaxID=126741 RepID=UPI000C75DB85|nr:lysylphosphatidylglycerol synthase transmembrane domain-containing protein [Thermotoga sp. KOL6]PLV60054.1 hypothetical protein AS005_01835 [Thermotoga sp. KOL6]
MKKNILLSLVIGVGAIVLIMSLAGSREVWKDFQDLNLDYLFWLSLNLFTIVSIDALRTKILLKDVSFKTCVLNSLWGFYAGAVTPFAAGGQPFQIYHLVKSGVPFEKAASTIAMRFFSSFSFTIVSGFVFFLLYLDIFRSLGIIGDFFFVGIVLAFFFYIFIIFLSFSQRFLERFFLSKVVLKIIRFFSRKAQEEVRSFVRERIIGYVSTVKAFWKDSRIKFFFIVLLSALMIVLIHASTYLSLKAVNGQVEVSLFQIISVQLALSLVVYFVPTPGASGAVEIAYYVVYSNIVSKAEAMISLLVWRFFNYYLFIVIGIFLGINRLTKKPEEEASG